MALTATLYTFDVALNDVDRGVYEQIAIKAACHPSESEEYLLTRVLAYCLEYVDGIAFSKGGISDPEDPPLLVKDLTGAWRSWIEVGAPDAARLHKASKASPRVALYTHKEPRLLFLGYEGQRIHRAESIEVFAMDRALLGELAARLERRMAFSLTVTEGQLFLDLGGDSLTGTVERLRLLP
ncbi:MAG: YaeQ family protein [Gemmatimonadetes bacterium]|nr:YaeQ family protein [Gemmatimonadota bacterium]